MNRQAGFTLIELIVALAVLALVTGLVGAALSLGTRGLDRADRVQARLAAIGPAQAFVRNRLETALPRVWPTDRGEIAFDGTAERIDFVAALPPHLAVGGDHALRLELAAGELRASWQPLSGGGAGFADVLADRAPHPLDGLGASARFAFFGPARPGEPPSWQSAWQGRDRLPALIRLTAPGAGWPDLVVAPRVGRAPR